MNILHLILLGKRIVHRSNIKKTKMKQIWIFSWNVCICVSVNVWKYDINAINNTGIYPCLAKEALKHKKDIFLGI